MKPKARSLKNKNNLFKLPYLLRKRESMCARQDTNYQYRDLIREELYYKTYKYLKGNKNILNTVLSP